MLLFREFENWQQSQRLVHVRKYHRTEPVVRFVSYSLRINPHPVGWRSIVMSITVFLCVCVFVCLFVCDRHPSLIVHWMFADICTLQHCHWHISTDSPARFRSHLGTSGEIHLLPTRFTLLLSPSLCYSLTAEWYGTYVACRPSSHHHIITYSTSQSTALISV